MHLTDAEVGEGLGEDKVGGAIAGEIASDRVGLVEAEVRRRIRDRQSDQPIESA